MSPETSHLKRNVITESSKFTSSIIYHIYFYGQVSRLKSENIKTIIYDEQGRMTNLIRYLNNNNNALRQHYL